MNSTRKMQKNVKRCFLLDSIVAAMFELLDCKYQTLLIGKNTFLILNILLHRVNGICIINL